MLDEIADVLRECDELSLEIAGHTDSQGREEMNLQLSQSRATAVLIENYREGGSHYTARIFNKLRRQRIWRVTTYFADNDTELRVRRSAKSIRFGLLIDELNLN